jgi:hypothetical protein
MSRRRPRTPAEILASGGPLVGIAIIVALHWIQPDLDPAREPVSNFALYERGWLLIVALFSVSAGLVGLAIALRRRSRSVWGPRLLCISALGFVIGAIFPITDGFDAAMHAVGAALGFGGLLGAMAVLGRAFRRERRGLRGLGTLTFVLFVPAFLLWLNQGDVDPAGAGTYQRLFIAITFGWLAIAGPVVALREPRSPWRSGGLTVQMRNYLRLRDPGSDGSSAARLEHGPRRLLGGSQLLGDEVQSPVPEARILQVHADDPA